MFQNKIQKFSNKLDFSNLMKIKITIKRLNLNHNNGKTILLVMVPGKLQNFKDVPNIITTER